ncbi:MAG: hypothetical protein MI810_16870 [Flavobacteriales bacterium]|nr:hypothetical protein [Flavobacteriales bacterium]
MIVYLTVGDTPSGVFNSQVVDVCAYLSELEQEPIKLVSFISIRNYSENKRKIKELYSNSAVFPMVPKLKFWKWNSILLFFFLLFKKNVRIIGRNSIPAYLGIKMKRLKRAKCVILDGRGAEYEQYVEFDMLGDSKLCESLRQVEKFSVLNVDYRIAVTQNLVDYWKRAFDYKEEKHAIIPCTLNRLHEQVMPKNRSDYQLSNDDVVLVYSGSIAGWQSFELMEEFFVSQLKMNARCKLILLCEKTEQVEKLMRDFPNQVQNHWLAPEEVSPFLMMADYGILIRSDSVTNKVAFPVKFAEYLRAGLKVVITDNIGNLDLFVREHSCGILLNEINGGLFPIDSTTKEKNKQLANDFLTKGSKRIEKEYKFILNQLRQC